MLESNRRSSPSEGDVLSAALTARERKWHRRLESNQRRSGFGDQRSPAASPARFPRSLYAIGVINGGR